MDIEEQIRVAKIIKRAREIPKEAVEEMTPAERYQLARVRDDVEKP